MEIPSAEARLVCATKRARAFPIRHAGMLWLFVLIIWVVALAGLRRFLQIPFNLDPPSHVNPPHWPTDKPGGYGTWDLYGLVGWLYGFPLGLVLILTSALAVMKNPSFPLPSRFTLVVCFVLFFVGFIGCILLLREDSSAFANWMGLWVLMVLFPFLIAVASGLVRQTRVSSGPSPMTLQRSLVQRRSRRVMMSSLLAVVILPSCFVLTTLLPNTFMKFNPAGLASSARTRLHVDGVNPERENAFLRSWNLVISEMVVLKIFPDTLLYYIFLELLAVIALISSLVPKVARLLSRKMLKGFSWGEFLAGVLFSVVFVLWTIYWLHDHNYHDGKPGIDDVKTERVARWFGLTGVMFMSIAILPVTKNSIWLTSMGISWESGLWIHRWFGAASLLSVVLHVVFFWIRWAELDILSHDILRIFNIPTWYPINGPKSPRPMSDNWTIPLMQLIAYPAFFVMGLPPILRRKNWELFKYLHFMFLVLIPATLLHAESAWYFLFGGVAFWLVDVAIRWASVFPQTPLVSLVAHQAESGVTEIWFKHQFHEPGQYCFVNVPAISLWEWHPFSLCSSPFDENAQICVKNMGQGTFTGKLFELAQSENPEFVINVDGPYGPPLNLGDHEVVVLIAGGIGITPIHSSFRMLYQLSQKHELPVTLKHIKLVWSGRSSGLFRILIDSIKECLQLNPNHIEFSSHLFLDDPNWSANAERESDIAMLRADNCPERLTVSAGRPNFEEVLSQTELEVCGDGTILVQVCGPPGMAGAVGDIASRHQRAVFESKLFVL